MPAFLLPLAAAAASSAAPAAASLTPSLIAGGAGLLGSVINAGSQLGTNSSQLSYSREMYDKQRADALADWNMQNEYNSPAAQMARFKEAGLNPNLIYGQMSNSPVVRSSSPQSYNPTAPQIDLARPAGMALDAYYDTQLKTAQIDNLKEQNELLKTEGLIKVFDSMGKQLDNEKNQFAVHKQKELYESQLDALKVQTENTRTGTAFTKQQILKIGQEIKNLGIDFNIKGLEEKLKNLDFEYYDTNQLMKLLGGVVNMLPGGSFLSNMLGKKSVIKNTYQRLPSVPIKTMKK
jgi:hypothetical protein